MRTDWGVCWLLEIVVKVACRVQFLSSHFIFGTVRKVWFVAFRASYLRVSPIKPDRVVKWFFASTINYVSSHVIVCVLEVLEFRIFWYWLVLSSTPFTSFVILFNRYDSYHSGSGTPVLIWSKLVEKTVKYSVQGEQQGVFSIYTVQFLSYDHLISTNRYILFVAFAEM
jgi:hypothetical protein